ncbi:MAG: aldo/keto reductase [SAR324 cluster bacterium]|nr:aldo/keto reductase [SAR324 cluster bacterium]
MQYTNFGNTGLVVSRISFGAMTFGEGTLVGELENSIDQNTANKMVDIAIDAGVNFFDTADMYTGGQSETMLGKALKKKRNDAIIATKCGFRSGKAITSVGLSYRYILQAAEASLKRLDTDYIDLFQVHIPDPNTPLEETARALDYLLRKGWVRHVGYCNYSAWRAQKMLGIQEKNNLTKFISAQMYYSLLGRDLEHESIPFIQDNRLGLMVWSPLASGFLTGKYTKESPVPKDSRRAKFDFPPINIEKGYEVVELMKQIGEKINASIPQVALAWLLGKQYVSSIIIGATKIHQLKDNLGTVSIKLSEEDIKALDNLTLTSPLYPAWMEGMGDDSLVKKGLQ